MEEPCEAEGLNSAKAIAKDMGITVEELLRLTKFWRWGDHGVKKP